MPSLSQRTVSYANAVYDRQAQTQELALDKATQTSDVVRDTTSRQAKIRNTPYDIGHELVTPSEAQQQQVGTQRSRADGAAASGQSTYHDQTPSTAGSTILRGKQ